MGGGTRPSDAGEDRGPRQRVPGRGRHRFHRGDGRGSVPHCRGSLAPVPRGSKVTTSLSARTSAGRSGRITDRIWLPLSPGPPGLIRSVPSVAVPLVAGAIVTRRWPGCPPRGRGSRGGRPRSRTGTRARQGTRSRRSGAAGRPPGAGESGPSSSGWSPGSTRMWPSRRPGQGDHGRQHQAGGPGRPARPGPTGASRSRRYRRSGDRRDGGWSEAHWRRTYQRPTPRSAEASRSNGERRPPPTPRVVTT